MEELNNSNNLSLWLYQCLTSLWRNVGQSSLQRCFSPPRLVSFPWCTALFRSRCSSSVTFRSGLWFFFFFSFRPCFGHRTDDLMLDSWILWLVDSVTARCSGPVTPKNNPNHHPSTSADSWYQLFGFLQTWHCAVQRTLFHKFVCSDETF